MPSQNTHFSQSKPADINNASIKELDEVLSLIALVIFYKHKAIEALMVSELCSKGFLIPYVMEEVENFRDCVFVKLTYKGRKMAQKCEKVFKQTLNEGKGDWVPPDLYSKEEGVSDKKFMMHHKRYIAELSAGNEERLKSLYASRVSELQ